MSRALTVLLLFVLCTVPVSAQPELPYKAIEGWPQMPNGYKPGAGMATAVDSGGHIWYYNRGSHPVIEFSKDGEVVQAWPEDPKRTTHATAAHGMAIGPDGSVWLVGREANTVWKFSLEGRNLLTIGSFSSQQGDNDARYAFDRPAAVAHDSSGNAYVADGYRNTRVAKYGPTGDYVTHWGGAGTGNGQFNLVHGVTVDGEDRVWVADRGNKRIQVFDTDGKFLRMHEGFGTPWALTYDAREKVIWMCDGDNGRVLKVSLDGKVLGGFGSDGKAPGRLHQVHGIAVDAEGSIYVAETVNQRIQKFVRR